MDETFSSENSETIRNYFLDPYDVLVCMKLIQDTIYQAQKILSIAMNGPLQMDEKATLQNS